MHQPADQLRLGGLAGPLVPMLLKTDRKSDRRFAGQRAGEHAPDQQPRTMALGWEAEQVPNSWMYMPGTIDVAPSSAPTH